MTYAQLRAALSLVAKYGDEGAPHALLPVGRWLDLRNGGCVLQRHECWVITARGWCVLEERARNAERPSDRPVQRKSSPAKRRAPYTAMRKAS